MLSVGNNSVSINSKAKAVYTAATSDPTVFEHELENEMLSA